MLGDPNEKLLTLRELSEQSGISMSTVRRRVKEGAIPVIQPGGPGTKMWFLPGALNDLSATLSHKPLEQQVNQTTPLGFTAEQLATEGGRRGEPYDTDVEKRGQGKHQFGTADVSHSGPLPNWMHGPSPHKPKRTNNPQSK